MWPNKAGLGSQLSFGVPGNGLVTVGADDLEPHLEFPRANDAGVVLNRIRKSYSEVLSTQRSLVSDLAPINSDYIPSKIIKSFTIESKTIESEITYDPTYGQMVGFFDIRSKSGPNSATAVAYVSGSAGNVVEIGVISYEQCKLKAVDGKPVLVPQFPQNTLQISFSDAVKQIEYCRIRDNFDTIAPYIAVRTTRTVHILKCFYLGAKPGVRAIQIGEITAAQFHGCDFADVCFNPYLFQQLAVVDVNGNFDIWNINTRDNLVKMSLQIEAKDPGQLSNWKKIAWGAASSKILLFSRVEVTELEFQPSVSSRAIITANTWSRIRDFKVVTNSMNYAFLLTSKELIWIELSDPMKRIMTWKHFLDDSDPSLKLTVCEYDDDSKFLCLVYSQTNQLIFVYNFGLRDDKPYSLRDPYYIEQTQSDTPILQAHLSELSPSFYSTVKREVSVDSEDISKAFGLFEVHQDLSLNFSIYSGNPGLSFLTSLDKANLLNSIERTPTEKTRLFNRLTRKDVLPVVESLRNIYKNQPIDDEVKLIQNYAYQIGKWASSIEDEQNCSLLDISGNIPLVSDVGEIDSMLEQLSEYFEAKDIKLLSFFSRLSHTNMFQGKILLIEGLDRELGKFKEGALASFNREENIKKLAILLGASLTKISIPSTEYSTQFEEEIKEAPSEIQDVLGLWDDEVGEDSSQATVVDLPSLPTINISQERPRTRKADLRRRLNSSQVGSQRSQQRSQHLPFKPSHLSQTTGSTQEINHSSSQISPPSSQISTQIVSGSSQIAPASSPLHSSQHYSSQSRRPQRMGPRKKRKGGFA